MLRPLAIAAAFIVLAGFAYVTSPEAARSYAKTVAPGVYTCARCRSPLFRSEDKFDSGTRWPSFRDCVPGAVATRPDTSYGTERTELLCAQCGAHLGHVFTDGRLTGDTHPRAGWRFCVLSSSLELVPERR